MIWLFLVLQAIACMGYITLAKSNKDAHDRIVNLEETLANVEFYVAEIEATLYEHGITR